MLQTNLLLSPHGDKDSGIFQVLEAVWTADRTNLPASVSPKTSLKCWFSCLYISGIAAAAAASSFPYLASPGEVDMVWVAWVAEVEQAA